MNLHSHLADRHLSITELKEPLEQRLAKILARSFDLWVGDWQLPPRHNVPPYLLPGKHASPASNKACSRISSGAGSVVATGPRAER